MIVEFECENCGHKWEENDLCIGSKNTSENLEYYWENRKNGEYGYLYKSTCAECKTLATEFVNDNY